MRRATAVASRCSRTCGSEHLLFKCTDFVLSAQVPRPLTPRFSRFSRFPLSPLAPLSHKGRGGMLPSPLVGEGLGVGAAGAGPGVGATGAGPGVRGMRPLPPSPTRGEGGGPDVGRNICRPRSCAGGDRPMEGGMSAAPTNLLRGMPLSNPPLGGGGVSPVIGRARSALSYFLLARGSPASCYRDSSTNITRYLVCQYPVFRIFQSCC